LIGSFSWLVPLLVGLIGFAHGGKRSGDLCLVLIIFFSQIELKVS